MTDGQAKTWVRSFLEEAGLVVTEIPESSQPTPDLLATGNYRYAIEIKSKGYDPAALDEFESSLAGCGLGKFGTPFAPDNRISGIIRKGVSQLRSLDPENRDFSLLWLCASGLDPDGQYREFLHTLYGLALVTGPDDDELTPCYCLRHSGFFRWRHELDGAVISTETGSELLLNSYSPRCAELALSDLAARFGSAAVVSPLALEAEQRAYVADCEIDRNDESAVLQYVAAKYGRPSLMPLNVGTLSIYAESPEE